MTDPSPARRPYGSIVSLVFLGIAIVLFGLIGFEVIDTTTTGPSIFGWQSFAFASFAASFIPWPI